jgi:hypothetical protein
MLAAGQAQQRRLQTMPAQKVHSLGRAAGAVGVRVSYLAAWSRQPNICQQLRHHVPMRLAPPQHPTKNCEA